MLKPKNIIIFLGVAVICVLVYIFFIKPAPEEAGLVSTSSNPVTSATPSDAGDDVLGTQAFLTVLLSVKSIKLNDVIFSDMAFSSLRDSSITLTPDGTEGRPNPFAPIGSDATVTPPSNNPNTTTPPNQPAPQPTTPPKTSTPPAVH